MSRKVENAGEQRERAKKLAGNKVCPKQEIESWPGKKTSAVDFSVE
jgi:hypothetical protein